MSLSTSQALLFACLTILAAPAFVPTLSQADDQYDTIVDVTGMKGPNACKAMQAAINDGLTGYESAQRKVLIRGQLGSAKAPADFSMFHNPGAEGASGRAWPYSVCHAFWPIVNTRDGEGVVNGYPDPFFPGVLRTSQAITVNRRDQLGLEDPICENFVFNRIRAKIVAGTGQGQMRRIVECNSEKLATVEGEWETPPDSTSQVRFIDWRNPRLHEVNLLVHYDLEVFYENSNAQGAGEYGVFADVGLHCYFMGAARPGKLHRGCLTELKDGIHRSGRIRIREIGRRDDGLECRPTWPSQARLLNRDYSIVWQAFGPGVLRGTDDTELLISGDGDLDNIGVLLFQTWAKDFRRWRINGIGTALWIAGSLTNTLFDSYFFNNEFGVVVGSNEEWGTGWPRWKSCFTGNCDPESYEWTGMNLHGGVVEGNRCGNFVMFGGFGGDVTRTFMETGAKDSPTYAGHSVIVGAGVCDSNPQPSPRQKANRSGRICGDDKDCGGSCTVNDGTRRGYGFRWDAVLAGNRGDSRWFAFMLGKGTQSRFLKDHGAARPFIRLLGGSLGGEYGHGHPAPYFYASEGAAQSLDVGAMQFAGSGTLLPAYDHYMGMPPKDLDLVLRNPASGYHFIGRLLSRSTCTQVTMSVDQKGSPYGRWTILHGKGRHSLGLALIDGGRTFPLDGSPVTIKSTDFDHPYVAEQSELWLKIGSASPMPEEIRLTLRCWTDG
jgi:hypothetical protein